MTIAPVISQQGAIGLTAGTIASTSFAAGAIDAAAIASDAIGANELAADAVIEIVTNLGGLVAQKGITFNGSTSFAAFTVTGTVAVQIVGAVTGPLTNHADSVSVGTATSPAGLIPATPGTALQTSGQIWVDNAPSKFKPYPTNWTIISESIVVVSTANIANGVVMLSCRWFPVVAASALVAAGGGVP